MTPDGIACRHCARQPHEPCNWNGQADRPEFHAERIEDAAGWIEPGDPPSRRDFKAAVEALGAV